MQRVEHIIAVDGHLQEDQGELVGHARPAVRCRAYVNGDVGVQVGGAHVNLQLSEVVAKGAGQTGDENIIDSGARHVLDLLDQPQIDRLGPCEQLGAGELLPVQGAVVATPGEALSQHKGPLNQRLDDADCHTFGAEAV